MARTIKAVAIVCPRGKFHLDKIARDPEVAWGLLADELALGLGCGPSIVEMRRMGFQLRNVTVTIEPR